MTETEHLDTELAAERLCLALLKLETPTQRTRAPGLNPLREGLKIAAVIAEQGREPDVASVWRRFDDLIVAIQKDLRGAVDNG